MANIKISQLTAAASTVGTQEFEVNESGTSKKVTGSQIKTFVKDGLVISDITSVTATAAELNYISGVTSAIQTQINAKAALASPAFTGQASFADGTAAAPSIAHTGDLDAGLFFPAADTVAVSTAGVEAMRIDSSGNVGIGRTPTSPLDIYKATTAQLNLRGDSGVSFVGTRSSTDASGPNITFRKTRGTTASQTAVASGDVIGAVNFQAYGGTNNQLLAIISATVGTYTSDTDISSFLTFATSPTGSAISSERLRIAADGQIGIGGANYGTSGQVLTSGGASAAPSWADGINRGTAVASTSGTAITFTGIPSWAKRVTVMLSGVSTSGTSAIMVQIGSGSFSTSGYSSTVMYGFTTVNGTNSTSGFRINVSGNASDTYSGTIGLHNIDTNNWVCISNCKTSTTNLAWGSGNTSLSGSLDRVRVTTVNGTDTFDAGSINILWE